MKYGKSATIIFWQTKEAAALRLCGIGRKPRTIATCYLSSDYSILEKKKKENMASCVSCSCGFAPNSIKRSFISPIPIRIAVIVAGNASSRSNRVCGFRVRASTVDSSSDFIRRMERAWLISQQPRPIVCSSCNSKGHIECKWCGGTGFLMLGDNMLCEVPSRNTSCINCAGKGSMCCSDCQGTGFRAKWLEEPPISE